MSALAPLGATLAALLAASGTAEPPVCACPCSQALPAGGSAAGAHPAPYPGPGLPALVHTPSPQAFALNRAGRDLYRQRRFVEARERYRAALAADPGFLGPRLNLACALVQEEQFSQAVDEAIALARHAFVPWGREIREAADMAPLTTRPERHRLEDALRQAGEAWGATLSDALLFVGRIRPAVRLPPPAASADGTLYVGLEQEIFAYLPRTGRYRQVTSEEGRVMGFLRSGDGETIVYVRAGKLVRGGAAPERLRGLTIRRLHLPTMTSGPPLAIPGDVMALHLRFSPAGAVEVDVQAPAGKQALLFDGHQLAARPGTPDQRTSQIDARVLVLEARGVRPAAGVFRHTVIPGCAFTVRDHSPSKGSPAVLVQPPGGRGRAFRLAAPLGAGLRGLRF